jgi:hypothetical protein
MARKINFVNGLRTRGSLFNSVFEFAFDIESYGNAGGGPAPEPNATFGIARFDQHPDTELVAPVDLWFTPTNINGFVGFDGEAISEPAGDTNVYDPTAIEVFWSWDFGEPDYAQLFPPNIPGQLQDVNRAYVKRPCHVFATPGGKTVNLYGYDSRGNWGTAQFVIGEGGDAPGQGYDDFRGPMHKRRVGDPLGQEGEAAHRGRRGRGAAPILPAVAQGTHLWGNPEPAVEIAQGRAGHGDRVQRNFDRDQWQAFGTEATLASIIAHREIKSAETLRVQIETAAVPSRTAKLTATISSPASAAAMATRFCGNPPRANAR